MNEITFLEFALYCGYAVMAGYCGRVIEEAIPEQAGE